MQIYSLSHSRRMRKVERGEERDTTMHLITIRIFTHAGCVTKLSTYESVCTYSYSRFQSLWGLYNPSIGSSPPKFPTETKRKASD